MKGKICIGVICIVILLVFALMCYLIKDINPPPLKSEEPVAETPASRELKFENVIFDDAALRSPDAEQFGLEKINSDSIQYSTYVPHPETPSAIENFNLWKYTPQKDVHTVWPMTTSLVIGGRPTLTTRLLNQTEAFNESTTSSAIQTSSVPVKRSVNDLKEDEDDEIPGSIIVKIKDDSGHFNIEIKLGPTDIFKRKRYRENKNQPQNKSKFSISLQNKSYDQFKQNELTNNTIISIMANDSVIVDECNDNLRGQKTIENNLVKVYQKENITDNIGLNALSVPNSTYHNNTDYDNLFFVKENPHLNITTDMPIYKDIYTLNVLFDNKTQFIKHSDAKQSDSNDSHIFEDLKKLTNISEQYETKLFNYMITNITDWYNSSAVPIENSTIENHYSIIEMLTSVSTLTDLLNSTNDYKTNSETSTVKNESSTISLQELNTEYDNLIEFENSSVPSNNYSINMHDNVRMTKNNSTLIEKKQDLSHNNVSYFM